MMRVMKLHMNMTMFHLNLNHRDLLLILLCLRLWMPFNKVCKPVWPAFTHLTMSNIINWLCNDLILSMQILVLFGVMWILSQISLDISPLVCNIFSSSSRGSSTISIMSFLVVLLIRVICHIRIIIRCLLHLLRKMMRNFLDIWYQRGTRRKEVMQMQVGCKN
jgi:hypothetical protein